MKKWIALLLFLVLLPVTALAHPGDLDSSNGHIDNDNVSGLGSYHYHCGDTEAHLHVWGMCPHSEAYKAYETAVNRLNEILAAPVETVELKAEVIELLCHENLPFHLKKETLEAQNGFLITTEAHVSIMQKPISNGKKVAAISEPGAALVITGPQAKGWYPVQYWNNGNLLQGYVSAKEVKEATLAEYALVLVGQL
ncbi:MAG: hypothetical protein E7329_09715 [Clostridiales bacterium]|nr:hypothetical protein [Clostridiales bacterium]